MKEKKVKNNFELLFLEKIIPFKMEAISFFYLPILILTFYQKSQ